MAKQIKIVDKQKKDTQATTKLNTSNKVQEGKDNISWFKYYENQVLNDDRFSSASEEDKKRYLNNLFDSYGKLLGADARSMPPDEYAKKKADYINGTFSKFTTEGIYDIEKKGTDTIPVMQTDTVPKVDVPIIAQDTTKPPKEAMVPPSQQPTGESDIIKQVKADAEKYYTDKGWPSPTWKLSEYEKGMIKIQSDYTSGKISPEEAQESSENLVRGLGLLRDDKEGKIYVSPTEVEMYREQVEKAYQRNLQTRAEKEKDPFMKDVLDALNIGANRVMTTPTRLLAVSESMGNGLMRLIGQKEKWGSTYWKDKVDQEKALSQSWSEANMRYDSNIAEMIQSGNTAGAAGQTILSMAENLPMLTVLIMGNAMGATNVALGYMGFDVMADEYITSKSDPNMTEFSRWVSALGKGMAEVVFENMGTVSILNSVRKGVQELGEQTVRDALLKGYTPFFTKLANMAMKGANNMTIEGMEEMSTQVVQNLIDIVNGKDVKLADGVLDAGIVGAAIGLGLSSPEVIANYKGKDAYTKRILDIIPDNMEFENKVELIELLLKADKLHQEQSQGVTGVEQVNKEQINQINQRIAELMGLMKEQGIPEGEVSTSKVVPAINPEDLRIDPDYLEWLKEERGILDTKISEAQARLGLPTTPDISVPDEVEETIDKIDRGEPVVNVRLKEASDFLYKEYKRLNIMKKSSRRMFTEDQINDMMDVIAEDITNFNNLINEQAESGEFKTKEVKLTNEVTVSQITEIGEGKPGQEQPVGEAGAEGEKGIIEEEPVEGEPKEEKPKLIQLTGTYGRPENFMTKPVKEFSGTFKAEQRKTYAEMDKVEERIKVLKQRRDQLTGRLTTDQRILKKEIEDDIFRAEKEVKAWDQGFIDDVNKYIDEVRPDIENTIDVIFPEATAEDREAIMGEYWTRMTEPTKEDINLSMEDLLINVIDTYVGKVEREGPAKPEVKEEPLKGEPTAETTMEPVFPEGYQPTIVERNQNWRYTVYQPDGESEASSLTLRKEPVETDEGKLLSIGILSTTTGEENKGLGTNTMKYAMANLPEGINGLIIPEGTMNNKEQVPRILEKLKGVYNIIEKPNGDIVILPRMGKPVEDVEAESVSARPKPEEGGGTEEGPTPEIKIVEIKKDLEDMDRLLDDLDFDDGQSMAAGGDGDLDARTKLLNIANSLVGKMIKAEIYTFPDMIREILPTVELKKLQRLIPFLKQGYSGYWATASNEISSKMDVAGARNFNDESLDQMIADMNKPMELQEKEELLIGQRYFVPSVGRYIEIQRIEEWDDPRDQKIEMMGGLFGELPSEFDKLRVAILNVDPISGQKHGITIDRLHELIDKKQAVLVPKYDNPEYRTELQKVIDVYRSIGNSDKVAELERNLWKEPKRSLKGQGTWQEEIARLKRMAQFEKDQVDILSGRIMYEPLPIPEKWTEQTLFDAVEGMVSRGEPISPYIKKWVPQNMIDQILDLTNKSYEFYAKLGIMDQVPSYLYGKIPDLGIIAALYPAGSKARAYENGRDGATLEKVKDAIKFLQDTIKEIDKNYDLANAFAFTWDIKNHILNAKPLKTWADVVRIGKKWNITDKGILRDQYELALVEIGRTIARNESLSVEDRWTQLLTLYTTSPGISETARTSDVKGLQQYSTPLPLAFLLDEYVNISEIGSVLEPSAGNGALLIEAKTKAVSANEVDPRRARNLMQQGYSVQQRDSSHGLGNIFGQNLFDAVVMNPPFGGPEENYHGWPLKGEYVAVAHTLEHLKPNSKAAIIVGGHVTFDSKDRMIGKDLPFFNWLNKYFNVEDVIQVAGSMYYKMGASYPLKVILINGRKAAPEGAAPLKNDLFNPITEWGDLKNRILALKSKPNAENLLQSKVDAQRGDDSLVGSTDTGAIPAPAPQPNQPVLPGQAPSTPIAGAGGGTVRPDGRYVGPTPNSGRRGRDMADIEPSSLPKPEGGIGPESGGQEVRPRGSFGIIQPRRNSEDLPVRDIGKPTERTKRELGLSERTGDEVTPYIPLSRMGSGNFIVPAGIANEVETSLIELRDEIGDVDEFVRAKLKYNSFDEMKKAFFAEQVDGIGQSIFNIEGGNAMIIGHQTGIGKGRISAGIIRYAIENGKFPVFITKSADLFTDMFRDLIDIGSPGYKPFIMNKTFPTGQKVRIFDPDGNILHEVDTQENDRIIGGPTILGTKELPEGAQMLFTTYSQFADKERDVAKREFLMDLARRKDVIFIMDESHAASGNSNTGQFFMDWLQNVGGGLFLSATYAKRPDNMPLYAMKTVLSEANMTWEQLVDTIKQGGEALQEIISLQLAEAGQFSKIGFKMDAEMNYLILGDTDATQRTYNPDLGQKMVAQYDGVTQILQEIIDFQKVFVNPVLEGMDDEIKKGGKSVGARKGTSQAGIQNTPYFSRVWQILDQLIVSIKVKDIVPLVIEDLRKGLKPVVTLKSTMEALFDSMAEEGDLVKEEMVDLDFSYVLKKGMTTVMKYTVKDEQGNPKYLILKPEDLTPMGRQKYYSLLEKIQSISTGIPLSPIDVLRQGIKDAGFDTIEITGRSTMFKLSKDMSKGEYSTNDRGDKIKALKKFNNNPGIAAIINSAGSTGISMHSSTRFADQAQRSMYILQNDLDINVVVQILGRVYRADQVNKPIYNIVTSMLPAELRMFMMNAKKLKSLDANTSGNQRQSKNIIDIPDFLNKYGDEAVIEYLRENPDINSMIEDPCDIGSDEPKKNRAAHRVTYRMQILPSWMQDEFNKDIIDRYERLIEYLNSTGRNDLMVTSEDLAAEIKERETVIQGHGGYSAFGGDTVLNVADVNVTRKPFSKIELQEELAKVPEDHVQEIQNSMEKGIDVRLNDAIEKVNNEYEEFRKMWKLKIGERVGLSPEDKEREYNLKVNELNERQENRILALRNIAEENKERFNEYLDYFKPGMAVYVPFSDEEQGDMFRQNLGVFLGFDVNMNKPNPWVPSNFVLRFATTDGRRMVKIPASKANHLGSIMHNSQRINSDVANNIIDNWDKHQVQRTRETRYIVTENVLQGLNIYNKGRLIQFTRADGTVDKGILMNENWVRPEDRVARIPINKTADIIKDLAPGEFVESYGGDIIIKKMYREDPDRWYELKVPQSTNRGSKYYLNDNLRDLVIGRQFEQHGNRMVASFREKDIQEILDLLQSRFKITLEVDSKNVQLSRDQTQSYETMNSYGQPAPTRTKRRGELSNPYNGVLGTEERQVGARITPAPITGETPKKMWEIQYEFVTSEGFKLRYARKPSTSRKTIGTYYPGTGRIVIKWHGDLNTTAHEMGHALDDVFGLVGPEAHNVWSDLKSELKDLWEFGSKPPQGHANPEQYRMMEGMAEFIRAYVVNPFETQQRFPFTYDWVKQRISKDQAAWDALNQFSRDVRIWWGSTAADQILSRIDIDPNASQSKFVFRRENEFGQFQMTTADRYARKYTNFFRPLEQAYRWGLQEQGFDINKLSPSQNWIYLSRLLLGQDVKMRNVMEHGIVDFEGNRLTDPETGITLSFYHMLSQIPNFEWKDMEANLDIAIKYGMAERIVEIPWKWQARQIRADLAAKGDYLPPEDILRQHPFIYDLYSAKIQNIHDRLNKGELNPEDVYLPPERYDFTKIVIAGMAQEGMTDYEIAKKAVQEYKDLQRTDPDKYKWISEFNRIYREIGRNIMQYARDSGLISEASFEQIDNENLYYMAMKRLFVMDPAEIVNGMAQDSIVPTGFSERDNRGLVQVVIHSIKGSRREIKNPVEALIEAYHQVVRNGDLNYSITQFAKAFNAGRDPYMEQTIRVGEVAWVSKTPEQRNIPFFINGKRRYLVIPDPEMFELMRNLIPNTGKDSSLVKLLAWLPQKLRSSIIGAPVFALRNIVRDFQQFMVIGRGIRYLRPQDFLPNILKSKVQVEYTKRMTHLFETTGGGQFGYLVTSKRGYYDLMKEAMFKISKDPKKWIYAVTQKDPDAALIKFKSGAATQYLYEKTFGWMMSGERVVRMLQFKVAVREGMDKIKTKEPSVDSDGNVIMKERNLNEAEAVIRAAYLSRDLMDFMVGGTRVREFNQVILFLNPAIRGLDRIYRSTTDPEMRKSVLARMGLFLAIPGIINTIMIALWASDDDKDEYLSAPAYERDMFFRIPVNGGWVLIPRPFELAAITSIFQRIMDKVVLGDDNAFTTEYFKSIGHLISPIDVAGIFGGYAGLVAVLFNYDFFRQKHIVPPKDVDISVVSRNTAYASQFSQAIMEASDIFSKGEGHYLLDARKLDAFIQSQFSYYGNFFLKLTELLIPGEGQNKFKFDLNATGFFRYASAYAEPNTQWVLNIFNEHPVLKTIFKEDYATFSHLITAYFSEESVKDPNIQKEVGKALRKFSAAKREEWKDVDFYKLDKEWKQLKEDKR